MNKFFKNLAIGLTLSALMIPCGHATAKSNKVDMKTNLKSVKEIKDYIKNNENVNILLYDENNKIVNEFHSDGVEINYKYSNGIMTESSNTQGITEKYEQNGESLKIKVFKDDKLIKQKLVEDGITYEILEDENGDEEDLIVEDTKLDEVNLSMETLLDLNQSASTLNSSIVPQSTSSYENYYVNGVLMNNLITDTQFVKSSSLNSTAIQTFLEKKNSILKDTVLVYRLSTDGKSTYFDGTTVKPSTIIASAATSYKVNPKLILVTLQKEQGLIGASPGSVSYSSRSFYYAMGYGATDSGDISGTSGFDKQISGGAKTLSQHFTSAPTTMPYNFTGINFGRTLTVSGVTYKNYIWVSNKATYSLYKYTPHAIDVTLYDKDKKINGGNYLFYQIFKGYWSTWD